MTPKEKAENLVDKFKNAPSNIEKTEWYISEKYAKQCALICVDEILNAPEIGDGGLDMYEPYWKEVKQEIEKI